MNSTPIVVFIHREFNEIRPSLLLAPEVAASFGWSNGSVISTAEAKQAIAANKAHIVDRGLYLFGLLQITTEPENGG